MRDTTSQLPVRGMEKPERPPVRVGAGRGVVDRRDQGPSVIFDLGDCEDAITVRGGLDQGADFIHAPTISDGYRRPEPDSDWLAHQRRRNGRDETAPE